MKFALKLKDGRTLRDSAAQVIVATGSGDIRMLTYVMPDGVMVGSHSGEDNWTTFLAEAGYGYTTRLKDVTHTDQMLVQIQPESGGVITLPAERVCLYGDYGDPAVAAVLARGKPVCCHCAEPEWAQFCEDHHIYQPREHQVASV